MKQGLLERLGENLKWVVLEVDLRKHKSPQKNLNIIKKDTNKTNYKISGIFENERKKGLYHIHLKR